MSKWAAEIEEDLKWREAELGSLKLAAVSAPPKSDRQRALLRALWTMLYAHYEGFCKFCWDLFLSEIERDGCLRSKAVESIAILSLSKTFQELRGDTSALAIWSFAQTKLPDAMREPVAFSSRLETKSNLWANLARENNAAVGLPTGQIEANVSQINAIVGRRNEIAHGKKLVVESLDDYSTYEQAAMLVMHELAVAVVDQLDKRSFALP
ncbi:MAG: MAE_28990/MAE_18760 family HEPN-like nuclease [bacterium]|nr:MAE_28990/MAE_18760 family HEPN-like nuclease [bacterium]